MTIQYTYPKTEILAWLNAIDWRYSDRPLTLEDLGENDTITITKTWVTKDLAKLAPRRDLNTLHKTRDFVPIRQAVWMVLEDPEHWITGDLFSVASHELYAKMAQLAHGSRVWMEHVTKALRSSLWSARNRDLINGVFKEVGYSGEFFRTNITREELFFALKADRALGLGIMNQKGFMLQNAVGGKLLWDALAYGASTDTKTTFELLTQYILVANFRPELFGTIDKIVKCLPAELLDAVDAFIEENPTPRNMHMSASSHEYGLRVITEKEANLWLLGLTLGPRYSFEEIAQRFWNPEPPKAAKPYKFDVELGTVSASLNDQYPSAFLPGLYFYGARLTPVLPSLFGKPSSLIDAIAGPSTDVTYVVTLGPGETILKWAGMTVQSLDIYLGLHGKTVFLPVSFTGGADIESGVTIPVLGVDDNGTMGLTYVKKN